MFGSIDKSKGLLFVTYALDQVLCATMDTMRRVVEGLEANRLLNTAPEDLKRYLVEAHGVAPIQLLKDQWYADSKEVQVDISRDQGRWIDDRSRPVPIAGERVEVRVPFQGESELFFARANTFNMNPPRAIIEKNELVLRHDTPADQARDIRPLARIFHESSAVCRWRWFFAADGVAIGRLHAIPTLAVGNGLAQLAVAPPWLGLQAFLLSTRQPGTGWISRGQSLGRSEEHMLERVV